MLLLLATMYQLGLVRHAAVVVFAALRRCGAECQGRSSAAVLPCPAEPVQGHLQPCDLRRALVLAFAVFDSRSAHWRPLLEIRAVKSSILERNVLRTGDEFAL